MTESNCSRSQDQVDRIQARIKELHELTGVTESEILELALHICNHLDEEEKTDGCATTPSS